MTAYYESQRKPFPNKVCPFGFPCRKRLAVSKGGFPLPCAEQNQRAQSGQQHVRAGDTDTDKPLSEEFFSSPLEWCKLIVFISRDAVGLFFHVPFHHLDVNNATWLPLLVLQWASERGR